VSAGNDAPIQPLVVTTGIAMLSVETAPTGWALSAEVVAAVRALAPLHLQIDLRGLRAIVPVARGGESALVEAVGRLTRELGELSTVELRQDVALITLTAPPAGREAALAEAGVMLHGIYQTDTKAAFVVESSGLERAQRALPT
jgi:hypothetical protein